MGSTPAADPGEPQQIPRRVAIRFLTDSDYPPFNYYDEDNVLTGFNADREAFGRPVGVAIDRAGSLLVADDVGNVIWRVGSTPAKAAMGN